MSEQKAVKTQAERKLDSIKDTLLQLRGDRIGELTNLKASKTYNHFDSMPSYLRGKICLLNTLLKNSFEVPEIEF